MIPMPERLVDEDFVPQLGLAITVTAPVQQLVPPYAALGEANLQVMAVGNVGNGDSIKFLPEKAECDEFKTLPVTDPSYASCACAGATTSSQGGDVLDGFLPLAQGIDAYGKHVVCHAFAPFASSAGTGIVALTDTDYEPQRALQFDGVNRSIAVPQLLPSTALVHYDTLIAIATPFAGYVRLVLQTTGGAGGGGRRLQSGDPCADGAVLVASAPGGALSPLNADGTRSMTVKLVAEGTYLVCHAFMTMIGSPPESSEVFTLQENVQLTVSYAVSSVTPSLLLLNQQTSLQVPGAIGGDYIKLMRTPLGSITRPQGCLGAAASVDGGMIKAGEDGVLDLRVVDAEHFNHEMNYILCHAFNYTNGESDASYNPLAGLYVTVKYPVQALLTLDLYGFPVRSTVQKRLSVRLPTGPGLNNVSAGDALVILPYTIGQCSGAAMMHRLAACNPADSGDVTAAATLIAPTFERYGVPDGPETRLVRLPAGRHIVCHAFAADLFRTDLLAATIPDGTEAPSPPPAGASTGHCISEAAHIASLFTPSAADGVFRQQYGITIDVEYPVIGLSQNEVFLGQTNQIEVHGGAVDDLVRLVPACELGCGNEANDPDFPFVSLGGDPAVSSPPPPDMPFPPMAPDTPASPGMPPPPYFGNVSFATSSLQAATYKLCYGYREDLVELPAGHGQAWWPGGSFPSMSHAVEVPMLESSTSLKVVRHYEPPPTTLSHDVEVHVAITTGDWAWFRLPMLCDSDDDDIPIVGCRPGVQMQAAIEVDPAFNRQLLRYHSMHMLLAHSAIHQPIASSPIGAGLPTTETAPTVTAHMCFDGLSELSMERFHAAYLQRPVGSEMVEHDVNGFTQRTLDRATFHAGTNTSSGGCNSLPTPELWLRLRCAAPGLSDCRGTVRATLLPIEIPPGYESTLVVPIEPGAADGASRLLLQVNLGEADIVKFSLLGEPTYCQGAPEELPFPNNQSAAFYGGEVAVQRDECPRAGMPGGSLDGYSKPVSHNGAGNATLEFFCTDTPGLYLLVLDAATQPLHTEGPPPLADDGNPTGAAEGAPLGEEACYAAWPDLLTGLNSNRSASDQLTDADLPRAWSEANQLLFGGPANVLRRGRLRLSMQIYRSQPFGAQPFYDGESREACLSYDQTRTFSIYSGSAANATLHLLVDQPISAAYARRDAPPDLENGVYDARLAIDTTPRWGCADQYCLLPMRRKYALTASSCFPDQPGLWYISLRLNSESATAAESLAATAIHTSLGQGSDVVVTVKPARFYLTMALYSSDLTPVLGTPSPTYTLPEAASAIAEANLVSAGGAGYTQLAGGGQHGGASYLGGGAMLHMRLLSVPRHLAPRVEVSLQHGTIRSVYVQREQCVVPASGLSADGGGESPSCGAENLPDCLVDWLSLFSPYQEAKVSRTSVTVRATALRAIEANDLPPADWWIALEANPEDLADASLTVTLLEADPVVIPLCFFERFCWDYDNPSKRTSQGVRDADDPALGKFGGIAPEGVEVEKEVTAAATLGLSVAAAGVVFILTATYLRFTIKAYLSFKAHERARQRTAVVYIMGDE